MSTDHDTSFDETMNRAKPTGGRRVEGAGHRGVIRRGIRKESTGSIYAKQRKMENKHSLHGDHGRARTAQNQFVNQHIRKRIRPTTM